METGDKQTGRLGDRQASNNHSTKRHGVVPSSLGSAATRINPRAGSAAEPSGRSAAMLPNALAIRETDAGYVETSIWPGYAGTILETRSAVRMSLTDMAINTVHDQHCSGEQLCRRSKRDFIGDDS